MIVHSDRRGVRKGVFISAGKDISCIFGTYLQFVESIIYILSWGLKCIYNKSVTNKSY